jgi:hypothetical protein
MDRQLYFGHESVSSRLFPFLDSVELNSILKVLNSLDEVLLLLHDEAFEEVCDGDVLVDLHESID